LKLKVGYIIEWARADITEEERICGRGGCADLETMRRCFALKHQLYDARRFDCPTSINADRSDYCDWNRG